MGQKSKVTKIHTVIGYYISTQTNWRSVSHFKKKKKKGPNKEIGDVDTVIKYALSTCYLYTNLKPTY